MTTHDQYRDDLPLLAAGALSTKEADALQRHVQQCSECAHELHLLTEAAAQIGVAAGASHPPVHLRARVLGQISPSSEPRKQRQGARHFWTWAPAFAAVILAIILFSYWRKSQQLEGENRSLRAQIDQNELLLQRSRALIETLSSPDTLHVTLAAAGKARIPEAKAIYSSRNRTIVLTANNLPSLEPHKAYQLWLLPSNGNPPVPYQTFKPDSRGNVAVIMQVVDSQAPKAFAVTVETEKGSQTPTMPIVLAGSV